MRGECKACVREAVPLASLPVAVTGLPPVPDTAGLGSSSSNNFEPVPEIKFPVTSPGSGYSIYAFPTWSKRLASDSAVEEGSAGLPHGLPTCVVDGNMSSCELWLEGFCTMMPKAYETP